jgi:hypothetical protein
MYEHPATQRLRREIRKAALYLAHPDPAHENRHSGWKAHRNGSIMASKT